MARVRAIGNVLELIKTLEPAMQRNAAIAKRQQDWLAKPGSNKV